MSDDLEEEELLHSAALQNSRSILVARQRGEEELLRAKEALESKTQQLAESLSLLRATLEATNDAILVTNASGAILEFNEQFVKLWDLPRELVASGRHEKVLEHNARLFSNPRDFAARVSNIYASGEEVADELTLKDGRVFERFSKIQYLGERPAGRVWSFRDVTTSRHAEETKSRLAAVVQSADDAIITKSLEGIITSWNAGAERIFGYVPEEVIGKPVTILFPSDRLQEEDAILYRIRQGIRVDHYQTERMAKDGTRISVSLSISPIKDGKGQIIGASKIARDITNQRRQESALRASEARLRAVVEASPECVKIVEPDGSLQFMNRAGLCMIEGELPEVQGASV